MIATIHKGNAKDHVIISSNDDRFTETWGDNFRLPTCIIYTALQAISEWAKDVFGEELLYKID